jgi:hypothetical protein
MQTKASRPTPFDELLGDLQGGTVLEKLCHLASACGLATALNGKQSKLTLELTFKRIGETNQLATDHMVKVALPTERGKLTEEDTTQTVLHCNKGGLLTLVPEEQGQFNFDRQAAAAGERA